MLKVFLDGDIQRTVLADCRTFLGERAIYSRIGRPFKRVYLIHGPPGTGKTSLIISIASELDMNLAICNVDSLRDDTFIELLSETPRNSIIMLEDVDSLFKERSSSAKAGGLTFSTLLNSLDGVLHPDGAIVFMTTNHVDKLDDALRRPGRVDSMFEIGYTSPAQRSNMWASMFGDAKEPDSLRKDLVGLSSAWLSQQLFQLRNIDVGIATAMLQKSLRPFVRNTSAKLKSDTRPVPVPSI